MTTLVYLMNVSLDGYAAATDGGLDWTTINEDVHSWFNEETRRANAFLYGRRLYELMAAYWPTAESDPAATPAMLEFAPLWRDTPKVVFSSTLESVAWNGRLVRGDPVDELARIAAEFPGEVSVGGPTLAAPFIERGLVDEYRLMVHPVLLGSGLPFFPRLERPLGLELIETRPFDGGVVLLAYRARR